MTRAEIEREHRDLVALSDDEKERPETRARVLSLMRAVVRKLRAHVDVLHKSRTHFETSRDALAPENVTHLSEQIAEVEAAIQTINSERCKLAPEEH